MGLPGGAHRLPLFAAAACLAAAFPAAAADYQLNVYDPLLLQEVTRQEGCRDVTAAGKRVQASCEADARLAVAVLLTPPGGEGERQTCIVSLRPQEPGETAAATAADSAAGADEGPAVGVVRDDYDSEEQFQRCAESVKVAPGGEVEGRTEFHVTSANW